jgi:hypothetical protein
VSDEALDKAVSDDLEAGIASAADASMPAMAPQMPRAAQLKPVQNREPTLTEQVVKMEQIGSTLRSRIRRDQLNMQHEYEHRAVEIRNNFERRIHDAITQLEKQRDAELQALTDNYNTTTREHELLTKRLGI